MLITLALLGATLASAQNGLKIENARFTFGPLGQSREKDREFLPGDRVYLSATVKGLTKDKEGVVRYSLAFSVSQKNNQGKMVVVEKGNPASQEQLNWLGGDEVPVLAHWPIPRDRGAPGEYSMTLTCTDPATKKTVELSKPFTVGKMKLGFVETHLVTAPVAVVGQKTALQYRLVGFDFDKKTKKTDVTIIVRVLDDKGKQTVESPRSSTIQQEYDDAPGIMQFRPMFIELNRPGKYKLEVSATCKVSKETAKEVFDLTVVEVK